MIDPRSIEWSGAYEPSQEPEYPKETAAWYRAFMPYIRSRMVETGEHHTVGPTNGGTVSDDERS